MGFFLANSGDGAVAGEDGGVVRKSEDLRAVGGEGLVVVEATSAHGTGEHGIADDGNGMGAACVLNQIGDSGGGVAVGFTGKDVAALGEHEAPVFGNGGGAGNLFFLMYPGRWLLGGFQDGLQFCNVVWMGMGEAYAFQLEFVFLDVLEDGSCVSTCIE